MIVRYINVHLIITSSGGGYAQHWSLGVPLDVMCSLLLLMRRSYMCGVKKSRTARLMTSPTFTFLNDKNIATL